jgi:hypothetical protein
MNLFKNKKGQRKKKHVQRGTGKRKKKLFSPLTTNKAGGLRLVSHLGDVQFKIPPQIYYVRKLEKLGLVQQSLEDQ